jgi:hypothetical protein
MSTEQSHSREIFFPQIFHFVFVFCDEDQEGDNGAFFKRYALDFVFDFVSSFCWTKVF